MVAVPDIPGLSQEVVEGDLKAVKYNVYVRPLQPSAPVTVDRLRELVVTVINANANVGPGGRLRVAASGAIELRPAGGVGRGVERHVPPRRQVRF
jgi:hypothetical protein